MRRLYYSIKALTPLHVGVGTGLGHIDLPIQREVHTKFPMIPGSAVKGALREYKIWKLVHEIKDKITDSNIREQIVKKIDECLSSCGEGKDCPDIKINDISLKGRIKTDLVNLFGCQEQAGRLAFSDLRILLFPVKSLNGVFAYVTSPKVIERLMEDLLIQDNGKEEIFKINDINNAKEYIKNTVKQDSKAIKVDNSEVVINSENNEQFIVLEEFTFEAETMKNEIKDILAKLFKVLGLSFDEIKNNLVILSNDAFNDFIQNYTEVQTHVKIDPAKGTVQTGALWTEEYLPAETYMYGIIFETRDVKKESQENLLEKVLPKYLHLGGDITTGKGFVKINRGKVLDNQEEKNGTKNG